MNQNVNKRACVVCGKLESGLEGNICIDGCGCRYPVVQVSDGDAGASCIGRAEGTTVADAGPSPSPATPAASLSDEDVQLLKRGGLSIQGYGDQSLCEWRRNEGREFHEALKRAIVAALARRSERT